MESASKNKNKEQNAQIIKEYVQWLKLEKSLSPNTVDAYQHDLSKLLDFLAAEDIDFLDVRLDDLQRFSAGLHDRRPIPPNCWKARKSASTCPMC